MTVYETEIPGVGRKFELELDDQARLVIVIHHDGRREVFHRPQAEADSTLLFSLTDEQARRMGSILEGAYFQPVEVESLDVPLGESIIEWIEIDSESPMAGQELREANVRRQTGASIIAIQRGEETISNPSAEFTVEPGDILVTLGTRTELASLDNFVSGEDQSET